MSLLDSNFELSCDSENQDLRSRSSFDVEVEDQNGIIGEDKDSIRDSTKKEELANAGEPFASEQCLKNSEQEEEKN